MGFALIVALMCFGGDAWVAVRCARRFSCLCRCIAERERWLFFDDVYDRRSWPGCCGVVGVVIDSGYSQTVLHTFSHEFPSCC